MFSSNFNTSLPMFGTVHLIFLSCFIVITIGLYFLRGIFASNKVHRIFVLIVASVLLLLEIYVKCFAIFVEGDSGAELLPFHLCSLLTIILLIGMFFELRGVIKLMSYWSILGPTLALIVINTGYSLPHFKVFSYMIPHFILFIMPLYYMWTKRISGFDYKSMLRSFGLLAVISVPVYIVDIVYDQNFMYFISAPAGIEFFNALGSLYTPIFVVVMFGFFNLAYLLLNLPKFIRKRRAAKV